LLKKQAPVFQYFLEEIPAHVLNSISVSSTRIREDIENGDMERANHLLGYTYFFSGEVMEGNRLGRTIGYPTANLAIAEKLKLIPGDGVYAVDVSVSDEADKKWRAMMNIGFRPTVDGTKRVVEVNIFNFDRMIYGCSLKVFVKKFLRAEVKFSSLDALKEQLAIDKVQANLEI
jgi:riboflavin kinase/FMN adenylyltransferase